MFQFDRHFTPDEANRTLDQVRPLVEQLMELRDQIVALRPELESGLQKALGNGGSKATGDLMLLMVQVRALIDQVQMHGALVKDIDQGLLDFPALREDREVFLCWKLGESTVSFWHELDGGFAGRRPL
jgi:hypothetical protein